MLSKENLIEFTRLHQTNIKNVVQEYCQHLFLSFLYQLKGAERLLFKGGTALRIVYHSPRFSEDLDFSGMNIATSTVETLFTNTLALVEKSGIQVELVEGKSTSGGYLGIATFSVYENKVNIQIEVSLRNKKKMMQGSRALIVSDYIPPYTLVHMAEDQLIDGKLEALFDRQKPRDFYDFFFLLAGNFPQVRESEILRKVLRLLQTSLIDFQHELKKFLPASQATQLRNFKNILKEKVLNYLGRMKT